ncbi:hypothetical protein AUR04nite_00540 [Glutamicibacter uratoxydans]|uniref:Major tail protein n=1 Tax=Glutamicibacter uratoxydans TaxID=43667 RepID=A0A4Y4DH21_GLUUR|nr:hypothetical protein [Glutamicibacter uratoxydans]GED04522.1 hypothetical protein AUR04nite_00540 [Glutamicibacter uratoxydans]
MARNDEATLKLGTGRFYTAPVGTALPANLLAPEPAWTEMGHSSIDDILSAASEGGERQVLSTLQVKNHRVFTTARTDSFGIKLHQFDTDTLKLYYGSNAIVTAKGVVQVPNDPKPTEVAWLFIFEDGDAVGGVYAEKASIFRSDDIAISDTESLAVLPLSVTPLQLDNNKHSLSWIPPKVPTTTP